MAIEHLGAYGSKTPSALKFSEQRQSLLSSNSRIQIPWVSVKIGDYSFGIFSDSASQSSLKDAINTLHEQEYPNYIQSLEIKKINGQINTYSLVIDYPITQQDDPNFFEKVFSSVSDTREITFSYGDMSAPAYLYKDETAIITNITQTFSLEASKITYTVSAVSGASLKTDGCRSFSATSSPEKPSSRIKKLLMTEPSLKNVFTGMPKTYNELSKYIAGDDKAVMIPAKVNVSLLDYISFLVGCMIPAGATNGISKDIYILTIHDETLYDKKFGDGANGPHFKVTRTSYASEQNDAYEIDVGYNTSNIVRNFSINQNENYSIYYDYQKKLHTKKYVRRINDQGKWEDVYSPAELTKAGSFNTDTEDMVWWTKVTKYPINASITIQGLLRPASLMTHVRLNIIFPGGHKHIASGLYIITEQRDKITQGGYITTLSLTKINGDNNPDTTEPTGDAAIYRNINH